MVLSGVDTDAMNALSVGVIYGVAGGSVVSDDVGVKSFDAGLWMGVGVMDRYCTVVIGGESLK